LNDFVYLLKVNFVKYTIEYSLNATRHELKATKLNFKPLENCLACKNQPMTLQHIDFITQENYKLHSLCNCNGFSISVWYEMKKTESAGPFELGEIWDALLNSVLMPSVTGWFEVTVRIHHFTERLKRSSYCLLEPGDWVLLSAEVISQFP